MLRQTTRHAFQAPTSLRNQQQSGSNKTLKVSHLTVLLSSNL